MKKWIVEDWEFDIEVIKGEAKDCRLGFEKGVEYETPQEMFKRPAKN